MGRHVGYAQGIALALAAAFAGWTWLTLRTSALRSVDAASLSPGVPAGSPFGQVLAAVAILTTPVVVFVALAGFSSWAARRRLRNLAWAGGLSIPLTWGTVQMLQLAFRRPRPDAAAPLITAEGWAYPSGHLTAITVLAVLLLAAMVVTRRRRSTLVLTAGVLLVLWWVVLADRWLLRAHWFTDLIGGGLLGGTVAAASLALGGVHVLRPVGPRRAASGRTPRAAVVLNPTKVPDPVVLRRQVEGAFAERGWAVPLWLETDAADSGAAATALARRRHVDLALVAGGDGTVRAVCAGLAQTGIPVGILPVGTGNLLARNLSVPLDMDDALDVALDGAPRPIDLVVVRADDRDPEFSLVMAGMGADATVMAETNADLKRVVGPAAYLMAALQTINRPPFDAVVSLDSGPPLRRRPGVVLVANVGALQGQILVAPDASPDDGLLDVVLASPGRWADWGAITTGILVGAPETAGVERAQARTVVVETDVPTPYQVDGDALGACRRFEASVLAGAVIVMVP